MRPGIVFTAVVLGPLRTCCVGQCCSLKLEDRRHRVWLCRVGGGVTVETYDSASGRWEVTSGSCYAKEANT